MTYEEDAGVIAVLPILQGLWMEFGRWEDNTNLPELAAIIQRLPTEPYIFKGSREGIEALLQNGDTVIIWTQGEQSLQRAKYETSGLTDLEKRYPGLFGFYTSPDKVPLLAAKSPDNIILNKSRGTEPVFILDDKAKNVLNAEKTVRKAQANGILRTQNIQPVILAWMRHPNGRSRNIVPSTYARVEEFTSEFLTVESMPEFFSKRMELFPHNNVNALIDWDHTVLWSQAWREKGFALIHKQLSLKI